MTDLPGVPNTLIPDNFIVPLELNLPELILRKLTPFYTELDYEAVMSCKKHLRQVFAKEDTWPADNLTLEEDRLDLIWHEDEFSRRSSFTYTVLSPSAERLLGAVYIFPPQLAEYDAEVYLWIREDELINGFDKLLYRATKDWLSKSWPFTNPAFPGRDIPWKDWAGKSITQVATHR